MKMVKERRKSVKEPLASVINGDLQTSFKSKVQNHGSKKNAHYFDTQFQDKPNILILQIKYQHVFILVGGMFIVLGYWLLSSIGIGLLYRKHLQHLPSEYYLQVRDDFALYPTSASKDGKLESIKYTKQQALGNVYNDNKAAVVSLSTDEAANIQEALGSLRLALIMHRDGKEDKAGRLFEHAYALAPKHPEVLLRYGEYLEYSERNIVLADQYYFQALIINSSNTEALSNRQRTAIIVQQLDDDRLNQLDRKRDALSAIHESNSALRRAKKEAYFQHIYHSVGIEGNTMSLAQTRSILETRNAIDGKSIDEHNEILGLDLAMKYINASLVNKIEITIRDILEIHRRVLGHVDPIEGGEFRRTQVYVGGHVPPGPGDLSILMRHFENWLNSPHNLGLHPVKQAALAHYKLVHIHPFVDGNGRTSRLLMNTLLMRAGYPPIIIPKQQRHKYYQYLQTANEGDIRPFVRFVADCTEKTLDLYLWATSDLPQQIPLLAQTELTLLNIEQLITPTTTAKTSSATASAASSAGTIISPSTNELVLESTRNIRHALDATTDSSTPSSVP